MIGGVKLDPVHKDAQGFEFPNGQIKRCELEFVGIRLSRTRIGICGDKGQKIRNILLHVGAEPVVAGHIQRQGVDPAATRVSIRGAYVFWQTIAGLVVTAHAQNDIIARTAIQIVVEPVGL